MLEIKAVSLEFPPEADIIVGQSHFIKTIEETADAHRTGQDDAEAASKRRIQSLPLVAAEKDT